MTSVLFEEISQLFDPNDWDVGVISKEQLLQCAYKPIKNKFHVYGADFTNSVHFLGPTNTIILIRNGHTWDYSHYDQSVEILKKSGLKNWFPLYTNFKEAAIQAGLGVRAKNSLVYSYKFGFDCHIGAIGFVDEIVNLPTNKRINEKLWKRCEGCDDCRKACPPGAIHNEKEPYWLDSGKCDNFIGSSDHPDIPSIKSFWHKNLYPEIPVEIVNKIQNYFDTKKYLGVDSYPFDRHGYNFDGNTVKKDGKVVNIPFCRECTSQPRCSQWNGKYPYDQVAQQMDVQPIVFKRGWSRLKK
jgi:ferredoxin